MKLRELSIQGKLMAIIMLTTAMALLLASAAFFAYDVYTFRSKMVADLGTLAQTMEANCINALVYNDRESAGLILSALKVQPHITAAAILNQEGQVFAEYRRANGGAQAPALLSQEGHAFVDHHLVLTRNMVFLDRAAGTFQIASDLTEMRARWRNFLAILVLVITAVSLLAFFFSSRLQRVVSRPILDLAQVARKVSEKKDYALRARKTGEDEIGRLIDGFNEMLGQIQTRDEELREARDKAEQANRSKSVFLANMSHELRTPLTAIIGYSEILEDDAKEVGMNDFLPDLQKIKVAGKHLLGLINSILDLSKVEAGKMELFPENFAVKQLVDEVASTVLPLVEKNRNTLVVRCPVEIGNAHIDLTKTRQILFNLLSNAAKFTADGTVSLTVERRLDGGHDELIFRVDDTGIGMNEEQLSRLFKPFSQADAGTARNYGGTGLGLALSRRFCQLMGGQLEVASELGKGSIFTLTLPAKSGSGKRPQSVHQLLESGEWSHSLAQGASKKPAKSASANHLSPDAPLVLVVDDDLTVHDLLEELLGREGFRVAKALTGDQGLALAKKLKPAIITLDVYMPELDGWTVLGALKADPELASTPVIMISVADHKKQGYALGAEYLTKPIDRDQLAKLLAKYRGSGPAPLGLVVDDEPPVRALLRQLLEGQGWAVMEAENGVAALRQVGERVPTLILLDLLMPELDGFGFLAQLRKNSAWREIPVVVLTAMDLGDSERQRLNGGVARVLRKGALSMAELGAEIRSLVRVSLRA